MDLGKVERSYLSGDKELLKKWDYDKNVIIRYRRYRDV